MKKIIALSLAVLTALFAYGCIKSTDNDKKLEELFDDKNTDIQVPSDDKSTDKTDSQEETKKEEYVFSESEKQKLISKYIQAENFYYDMLYQNFELDNMDIITLEADGYENNYHRVLLVDVNSLSELKSLYLGYFTQNFVESLDFSAYHEENGKLYCAETAAAAGAYAKYTCTAESTDGKAATVTRKLTDGSSSQKISAVKNGDDWFFSGVAIR